MLWSGAAWKDEVRQAWLVQVCCGASGRVKVRYGLAGKAGHSMVSCVVVWQAGHGTAGHGTAGHGKAGHGKAWHGTESLG